MIASTVRLITRLGEATLDRLEYWSRLLNLAARLFSLLFSPASYNRATRSVLYKQIYFTAWQILPTFTLFAALLSLVLIQISVSTARDFGLADHAMETVIRVLVLELLPLFTALFVALRSGAAINTELALMNIHNEIHALEAVGIDPLRFELLPRLIGGMLSVLVLTAASSLAALLLAYLAVYGLQMSGLGDFSQVMAKVLTMPVLLGLWAKCLAFGVAVTLIPMGAGLNAPRKLFFAPIAVLQGMVRLFFVLMLIEVVALTLSYI